MVAGGPPMERTLLELSHGRGQSSGGNGKGLL